MPLGDGITLVPTFPPGFPMTMAVFERIGGPEAVFLVVPVLAAVAVGATFLMGGHIGGPFAGAFAAVLLAASPIFLAQSLTPMTDVPVTAWWAICLVLLSVPGRGAPFASGLAAGMAVLTRMNLAPLLFVPLAMLVLPVRTPINRSDVRLRVVSFAAGVVPGALAALFINATLYGSPFRTGLGSPEEVYAWRHAVANLTTYPRWLVQTETPVVLLALAAPWLIGRQSQSRGLRSTTIGWLGFAAAVWGCYLWYLPHEDWFWLRYLLPALPPLLALTAASIGAALHRLRFGGLQIAVGALLIAIVASYGIDWLRG